MRFCMRYVILLALICCLLAVSMGNSYAYIDPGTGSYLLQLIGAGVFASIFAIKVFWRNIKALFTGKRRKE